MMPNLKSLMVIIIMMVGRINNSTGIKDLYDSRLKLKKYNPAQMVIKVLMNSMYGKTMIKPIETDTVIKNSQDDFGKYISYNYNYIYSVLEVNGRYYVTKVK